MGLLLLGSSSISTWVQGSLTAFLSGEAKWSKAQKDAVNALIVYVSSGDQKKYDEFKKHSFIPQQDMLARLELSKNSPNFGDSDQFLINGGNHPDDVRNMGYLFRYGRKISYIEQARIVWERGDQEFANLLTFAEQIHAERNNHWSDLKSTEALAQILAVNSELTKLEIEFSEILSRSSRNIRVLSLWINNCGIMLIFFWVLSLFFDLIKTKKELQDEFMRSNTLTDGLNEAAIIAVTEVSGKIIFVNQKFCEASGFAENELIGSTHRIFKSGLNSADFYSELWSKILTGKIWSGEVCNRKKDGTLFWVNNTIVSIYSKRGERQFLSIAFDISDRKRAEEKLVHSAKMATLGELSAGLAHEINNPLTIISGAIRLVPRFLNNPEKLAAKIELINKSCERIAKIILGLKKFSRADEKLTLKHCLLSNIVNEVMNLTESKSTLYNVRVTCDIKSSFLINCDEVRIEQVLVNLVNNAIDAIKELPEKWVKVSVFEEGSAIVVQVMDSGPGIPKIIADRIFEPFYTTKKVGEGTGLGLSLSKGILDEHNATICILQGLAHTCFEIRFPKVEVMNYAI
jgi:PAS domain S-box-containing protein